MFYARAIPGQMANIALLLFALFVGVFGTTKTCAASCKKTVTVTAPPTPSPTSALPKSISSCQHSSTTLSLATLSTSVATPTPYNYQLFSGYAWPSDCLLMQFCNSANFQGDCIVAHDNTTSFDEGYCINLPYSGVDQSYHTFLEYYGNFNTLSYRARTDLRCSTFFMPNCTIPTNVTFSGSGITNATAEGYSSFFSSFHCYPADEAEPNRWGSATTTSTTTIYATTFYPSLSSTLTSTVISLPFGPQSSIVAGLRNYFDPLVDDILICGNSNTTQCASGNFDTDCSGGWNLANPYGIDEVRVVAAGYEKQCVLYGDSGCESGSITIQGAQPATLSSALAFPSSYFKCWNTKCAAPTDTGASKNYASCTSSLPAPSGMYTISPVPVMTMSTIISFIGASSALASSTTASPSPVLAPLTSTPPASNSPASVPFTSAAPALVISGSTWCTTTATEMDGATMINPMPCNAPR